MNRRARIFIATALLVIAASSFLVGRRAEEKALAAKARLKSQETSRVDETTPGPVSYHQLVVSDILALPFPEFYEALRAAPDAARKKWAAELERMPPGPQRRSAVRGFYKLLVQFDPKTASKNACEIGDKDLRNLALQSVAAAAPGFALKDIATLLLNNPADGPDYQNLDEILSQWITVDPADVAKFFDERRGAVGWGNDGVLVEAWAAIDPEATSQWMKANNFGPGLLGEFLMGLYQYDPAAAADYAVMHAEELVPAAGLGSLLSALYSDSREDAKKFIERLPNDELRHNAFRGFEFAVNFGTAEETGEPDRTPRAIADWMVEFPPTYWRGYLADVFDHWNDDAQQDLFAWIEGQPPTIRSAVAAEYKMPVGGKIVDVVSALLQYGNTELRDQLLLALFQNSASDIYQMREAIARSSLPAAQKDLVLQFASKAEAVIEEQRAREKAADGDQGSEK